MLQTLGAARVGDREITARARDFDKGRRDTGAAAATLVFDRGRMRRCRVLPGILEPPLIEGEARELGGDPRREMFAGRRSLGDGASLGKGRRRRGEVSAFDGERRQNEQGRCGIGGLRALRERVREGERAPEGRLGLGETAEPEKRAAESPQRAGLARNIPEAGFRAEELMREILGLRKLAVVER